MSTEKYPFEQYLDLAQEVGSLIEAMPSGEQLIEVIRDKPDILKEKLDLDELEDHTETEIRDFLGFQENIPVVSIERLLQVALVQYAERELDTRAAQASKS